MAYSVAHREHALDFMDGYPEYGEQRWYSDALGTEQPPDCTTPTCRIWQELNAGHHGSTA